jgi:dynein light intermediate chain
VENNGKTFARYTSTRVPTREDVIALQVDLDQKLALKQAAPRGICPVRSALYTEAMDELVREVTVLEPDRGLLLLRVRDQLRLTSDAYRVLSEHSVAFAAQKQCAAIDRVAGLPEYVAILEARKVELEEKRHMLSHQVAVAESRALTDQALGKKTRAQEIRQLKVTRATLEQFHGAIDNDPSTSTHHEPREGRK